MMCFGKKIVPGEDKVFILDGGKSVPLEVEDDASHD